MKRFTMIDLLQAQAAAYQTGHEDGATATEAKYKPLREAVGDFLADEGDEKALEAAWTNLPPATEKKEAA